MTTQNQIIDSINKEQDEIFRVINTLNDYTIQNLGSEESDFPIVGLNENGQLSLIDPEGQVIQPLVFGPSGTTTEKVVIQKEIIVASDGQNKQTVQEIDFNGDDFAADRDEDANIIRVSLKNRPDFGIFVSDNDPILTTSVSEGNMWFYTILGKMYVRYQNFWVQPHPA